MKNMIFLFCLFLTACAKSISQSQPTVPIPDKVNKNQTVINYAQSQTEQYIYSPEFVTLSKPPHFNEPKALKKLLNVGIHKKVESPTKVKKLRPCAIRDAAHLVALQTAMSWTHNILLNQTEKYKDSLDSIFYFQPLLLEQGQTLIMPPIIAKTEESFRIEDAVTATASQATYEILQPAKFISIVPNWRYYLMSQSFPKPQQPNSALLPRNQKELEIWRAAVREGWYTGIEEAMEIYKTQLHRLARDYRGCVLYHMLTAQHLLSKTGSASVDLGLHINKNKMHIKQKVFRITVPSRFLPRKKK